MYRMQWDYLKVLENKKTVLVRYFQDVSSSKKSLPSYWKFETDGIFYNNSQKEVYNAVMDGVIKRIVDGNNAVILSFGQTGCGKTLTASGLNNCFKDRGIALRLITDIFAMKRCLCKKSQMCVQMSYIETKNVYFNDLFRYNYEENLHNVKDVTAVTVNDEYEAMNLLFTAESRRKFANDSVISHAANGVLTLTITTKPLHYSNPTITVAKVHVIDLGGSDNLGNDPSSHKNLIELNNANLTKTNLEQFMLLLIKNDLTCISVKRRINVLLQYLSDAFNNHSVLRFIGHIRVEKENLLITLSMLKFGQTLRCIKPEILQPNVSKDPSLELACLKNKLKDLQAEADLTYMIGCSAQNVSQDRVQQMQNITLEYLQNKTDEIVVCSVSDVTTILKVFKDLYNKLEIEKMECTKLAYEKAYKDALSSVPRSDSATSPKVNRRTSKSMKTRDSVNIPLKKCSQGSLSPKPALSVAASKSMFPDKTSTATKSGRRSRMSINLRKKASSKRKSTNGSDVSPINEVLEEDQLATSMPHYSEAWSAFVNDGSYNYSELEEERLGLETQAKAIQRTYLDEVRSLQFYLELVDIRKTELQKAEMLRLFGEQTYDDDGNTIISEYEKLCLEHLESARNELTAHQEQVLKYQSDFIIALQRHLHAKKDINEKFNDFCQKNYHVLVPNLDNASVSHEIDEGVDISCTAEDDVPSLILEDGPAPVLYHKLQKSMKQDIRKIKLTRERNLKMKGFK